MTSAAPSPHTHVFQQSPLGLFLSRAAAMGNKPSRIPVYRYPAEDGAFHYKFNVRRLTEKQITQYILTPLLKNRYSFSVQEEDGKIKVYAMRPQAFKELFGHLNPRVVDMTEPTVLV